MKYLLLIPLLALLSGLGAFYVYPYCPDISDIQYVNLDENPLAIVNVVGSQSMLNLSYGMDWIQYQMYPNGLPVTGICRLNEDVLMLAMGCGTYSDGVYNFDLDTHNWQINEWFFWPHFLKKNPVTGVFYVGERDGLFKSDDGANWIRLVALGSNDSDNLACYENHIVTNNGNVVWYSDDSGGTWLQSQMPLLKRFRFTNQGVLYASMNVGSDSDGLWRSLDYGATWEVVFYTTNLDCIGPDMAGYIPLGWSQPNDYGHYVELLSPADELIPLSHPDLSSPVKAMEVMPMVNMISFYVHNGNGIFYLGGFIPVETDDPAVPPATVLNVQISPNPATSRLDLTFGGKVPRQATVGMYDQKGRQVHCWPLRNLTGSQLELDVPPVPSGVYFLRIDAGKASKTLRTVIFH
jgi:hypothetical protein